MGVIVEDIRILNQFTGTSTNYLLGNVGDKITVEVDVRVEEIFVSSGTSGTDVIMFFPAPYKVNSPLTNDIIYCEEFGVFDNYRVGDIIGYYDSVALGGTVYEIYEILSSQAVRIHTVGGVIGDVVFVTPDNPLPINSYLYLATPLTAIKYRWNFIGNNESETYLNKIDNQLNQARSVSAVNAGSVTPINLLFDSPATNHYGSTSAKGNGTTLTSQKFTITHETIITPFFLAGNLFDLQDGIAPNYLNNGDSLRYIFSVDIGRNSNDPNYILTEDFTINEGNVGWYDENFKGGANNYAIDSIVYKNALNELIGSVELTDNSQTVEIIVSNTNNLFLNNNTEFTLNFSYLPETNDEVTNNNQTIIQNFHFDRGFNTVGSAFIIGDNDSTNEQVFTEISGTFIDANHIKITGKIEFFTSFISLLTSDSNYLIWVSVQNHLLDTEESDRVNLIAAIDTFYVDLSDDGLVDIQDKFLLHYETDIINEGSTEPTVRIEDDVLAYTRFTIDRNGRENDSILIQNIDIEIIAKKIDGSEFTLESYSQSFSGTLIVNDTQFIDTSSERVFKMPDNDPRKTIKVKRRIDLDTVDLRYYEIYYPFLMRWEYWEVLSGVNSDAFNINLPNNGRNRDWQHYDNIIDWDIYYRTKVTLTKNGNIQIYQNETILETFDYREDLNWINEDIQSYNSDTLAPLNDLLVSPCKIVVTKEYAGTTPPLLSGVEWVMRIEIYEQGGITDIRYLSSVYDWTQYSWFNSVDNSNKVVKDVNGLVYSAECLIDFNALPDGTTFKISGRIYDKEALPPFCCLSTEDDNPIMLENGNDCISPDSCDLLPEEIINYESEVCNLYGEVWDTIELELDGINVKRIKQINFVWLNIIGYTGLNLDAIQYSYEIIAQTGGYLNSTFANSLLEISLVGGGGIGGKLGGNNFPENEDAILTPDLISTNDYLVVDCYARDPHCGFEFKYRISYGTSIPVEYLVNGQTRGEIHKIVWSE